jgi:hypothetical protein
MIGLPVAVVYTNAFEWFAHKYLLHGMGKRRESFWSFHWHEHHRESRKANMFDPQYTRSVLTWSPQGKEALSVIVAALLHLPLFFVAPFFTSYVVLHAIRYYWLHKRAHQDQQWCKEKVPWHYDHHMGRDQNANWCVTHPWFDYVMGTRKKYVYDASGLAVAEEAVPAPRGVYDRFIRPVFEGGKERVRVAESSAAPAPAQASAA